LIFSPEKMLYKKGEDGGNEVSEYRRATQASYKIKLGDETNPLFQLQSRIYGVVNRYAHYNLNPEGQVLFIIYLLERKILRRRD